jgi:hypothetical protein
MSQLAALFESNAFRTLIAIVAIGVSILIYRLNKKKKALSYEVLRNDRIFRVVGSLASRVQITVDGKSANNVSLILVDIQNSGNEPIKRDDFDTPLQFEFGAKAEILSARVLRTKPSDLVATIDVDESKLTLNALLLNKNDSLTIEALVSAPDEKLKHSVRIVGVADIKTSINNRRGNNTKEWFFASGLSVLWLLHEFQYKWGIEAWFQAHRHPADFALNTLLLSFIVLMIMRAVVERYGAR